MAELMYELAPAQAQEDQVFAEIDSFLSEI